MRKIQNKSAAKSDVVGDTPNRWGDTASRPPHAHNCSADVVGDTPSLPARHGVTLATWPVTRPTGGVTRPRVGATLQIEVHFASMYNKYSCKAFSHKQTPRANGNHEKDVPPNGYK